MSEKEKDETERDEDAARDDEDEQGSEASGDEAEASEEDASRAARVAEALGVSEDEEAAEGAEGEAAGEEAKAEDAGPPNRAQRRREEAIERRRKRKGLPAKKATGDDSLPRDKNKRAKELLARRREVASEDAPAQLDAGEMVDDALARGWHSTTKWVRNNLSTIQWIVAVALVGVAGFVAFTYFSQQKTGAASALLASGALAEDGYVMEEDKRDEDDKELDPTPVFKTAAERDEKALTAYRDVELKFPGTGAAILGKLGEAGVLLDQREWDKAIDAYETVLKTPLASADADVKGRAIEGLGLAKEGKGDLDGAAEQFRRMESIDAKGFQELSQWHQARMLLAKNTPEDRDKAKELLKAVYEKLKEPSLDKKQMVYLQSSVEQALRQIDPSAVPDRDSLQGVRGGQMSQEEIQRRIRQLQEDMAKKQQDGDGH